MSPVSPFMIFYVSSLLFIYYIFLINVIQSIKYNIPNIISMIPMLIISGIPKNRIRNIENIIPHIAPYFSWFLQPTIVPISNPINILLIMHERIDIFPNKSVITNNIITNINNPIANPFASLNLFSKLFLTL